MFILVHSLAYILCDVVIGRFVAPILYVKVALERFRVWGG